MFIKHAQPGVASGICPRLERQVILRVLLPVAMESTNFPFQR
jgi:hypothetical protein